jgi:hypothetical protein
MQTVVKAVIPALVGLFTVALAGQGTGGLDVEVRFPGDNVNVINEFAAVAYNGPDGNRPGVAGLTTRSSMGNLTTNEDVIINCCLSAATGDDDVMLETFALVAGWYDLIVTAILADVHLAGTVPPPGMVEVGPFEWYPSDQGGSSMTVLFGIHIAGAWQQ